MNLNIEERSDVVYHILELAKNNLLNEVQKQKFHDIVIKYHPMLLDAL